MLTLKNLLERSNGNIVGIGPDLTISTGYDSGEPAAGPGPLPDYDDWTTPMPKAEKLKLADLMLDRWTRYKAAVMEEPGA